MPNCARSIIKTRGHFPTDDAASKLIWLALRNITADWGRAAKDWKDAMNQFANAHDLLSDQPAAYPEKLPAIEYGPDDTVVTVKPLGLIRFRLRNYRLSKPLRRQPVAIRHCAETDELFDVLFVHHKLMQIDLREPPESST